MSLLGLTDPGFVSEGRLLGLVMAILRLIAYSALGTVVVGLAATICCYLFDDRKWKAYEGRSLFWRLTH